LALFGKKDKPGKDDKAKATPATPSSTDEPLEPRGPDGRPMAKPVEQSKILHSSQLDERMRKGDVEATGQDKGRKVLLDTLIVLSLLLIFAVLLGRVGIGVVLGVAQETYALAFIVLVLIGCSYLFNTIRWRALRGPSGAKVLDRAKAEIWLTAVSILALCTVIAMAIIEVLALLVFMGAISSTSNAAVAFAENFVLLQAVMLLVYLLALVARETNVSTYQPSDRAKLIARILTPLAVVTVLVGVILASGLVQLGDVQVRQAVYIVTLGVLFEFLAMRIRLRLPSLYSHYSRAMEVARRASPEVREDLQKRARRTYIIALIFVALTMGMAGLLATGTISVEQSGGTAALLVFYGGAFLVIIGLVVVRYLQTRNLRKPKGEEEDELANLVQQKRRGPEEILRYSVYGVTGFFALIAAVLMLLTGLHKMPWHEKYATDLFILAAMFGAGPYGYFNNRESKRIAAIDEKFPDFLRDLAESARAGMTLPRALVSASQGTYGALTQDIKTMAAQVDWGVEFGEALTRFANRTKTPLIDRTVSLIVEAQRAGGSMVDILTAASEDAREIKQIVSERNTQMSMYNVVIYIAFFVFLVVIMVLSAQFIPAFKKAVGAASGQKVGGLTFKDFDPEDYNTLFFHASLVQAIGGGLVGGVLAKGNAVSGFMNIAIMMFVAWLSFRVVIGLM
jgi:archaeal flagellar protein FlaJ